MDNKKEKIVGWNMSGYYKCPRITIANDTLYIAPVNILVTSICNSNGQGAIYLTNNNGTTFEYVAFCVTCYRWFVFLLRIY